MDKFKVFLAGLKKHHFWALCAVVVLGGIAIWFVTAGQFQSQFAAEKGKLETKKKDVETVRGDAEPHNDVTLAVLQNLEKQQFDEVWNAWNILYRDQKEKNRWPEELGPQFIQRVESLGPDEEIPVTERYDYGYFIRRHLPKLRVAVRHRMPKWQIQEIEDLAAGKIDSLTTALNPTYGSEGSSSPSSTSMPPGVGGRPGVMRDPKLDEMDGVVNWNPADYQKLESRYSSWDQTPTTLQVRYAQEDLWVYWTLIGIIAKTNEDAQTPFRATVKGIQTLDIAQAAAVALEMSRLRTAIAPASSGSSEGSGSESGSSGPSGIASLGPNGPSPFGGVGASGGSSSGSSESSGGIPAGMTLDQVRDATLKHWRYWSDQGPVAHDAPLPSSEFKMMPVRMILAVDSRRLQNLLTNCVNSPMPVEVRRISALSSRPAPQIIAGTAGAVPGGSSESSYSSSSSYSGSGSYSSGMSGPGAAGSLPPIFQPLTAGAMSGGGYGSAESGSSGYGYGSSSSYPSSYSSSSYSSSSSSGTTPGQSYVSPYDVTLQIEGVIYIFNPPDASKLGKGAATEGATPAAPAAPAGSTTTAATTPTPAQG